ncbi:MAG: DUF6092 family protein [Thermoplasmata archaeon]
MNLEKIILERRAVRKFTGEKLRKEAIDKIIEAGIWAPTGGNAQSRVFVTVTDPEKIKNIRNSSPGIVGTPPLIIVLGTELNKAKRQDATNWHVSAIMDVAMAAENMILMAYDLGIGSCPILSYDENNIKKILAFPVYVSIDLLVTFGIPAYIGKAPTRRDALIYFDDFGAKYDGAIKKEVDIKTKNIDTFEKEQATDLLRYIIFSAKNLKNEPREYVVYRLIELAGRVLENIREFEKDERYIKIKEKMDLIRFGDMKSEEELYEIIEYISNNI